MAILLALAGCLVQNPAVGQDQVWRDLGGGLNDQAWAMTKFGEELVVGGAFTMAGKSPASYIAKWNGDSWTPFGEGMNGSVYAVAVYGGELIAGGSFTIAGNKAVNHVARWNGSSWQSLGSGMNDSVWALATYNGELFAGGFFTTAGGANCQHVARWNGSTWLPAGEGFNDAIRDFAIFNGELVAGGDFTAPLSHLASWNGIQWQSIGGGVNLGAEAMAVYGGELVVAGEFTSAGGVSASRIARWDGAAWHPLGTGVNGGVYALTVHNGDLVAGGYFSEAGGQPAENIARWNGVMWQPPLGSGLNNAVWALESYHGELVAAGEFTVAGGRDMNRIARTATNSTTPCSGWQPIATGISSPVRALCSYNNELVAAGYALSRWDGAQWHEIPGLNDALALTVHNNELVAGGGFLTAGQQAVFRIARWNGQQWQGFGQGFGTGLVLALAVYRGDLIAGGTFTTADGQLANCIARWDGTSWRSLGTGLSGGSIPNVAAMVVVNDKLIVAGQFSAAGGTTAGCIAQWDGSTWQPMGSGFNGGVMCLAVYNGGVIAGGMFSYAGIRQVSKIARWNGSSWEPLGLGVTSDSSSYISALEVDNGELVAGGDFESIGGIPAHRIARWDGIQWHSFWGAGLNGIPNALFEKDNRLWIGGDFTAPSQHIVKWGPNDWIFPVSGQFLDDRNWSRGFAGDAPSSFGLEPGAVPFFVSFKTDSESDSLCILNQRPHFQFNGHQLATSYTTIGSSEQASLTILNGLLVSPSLGVGSFGTLGGNGTIVGSVNNVGVVRPGDPSVGGGTLTINGNYTQIYGLLNTTIASSTFGQLAVGGNATIAGTLKVDLVNNASPHSGEYPLLTVNGTMAGTFGAVLLPFIGNDLVMNVQYANGPAFGGMGGGAGSGVSIVIGSPNGSPELDDPTPPLFLEGEPTGISGAAIGNAAGRDLAMSIKAPSDSDPGNILVLLNQGDGTAFTPVVLAAGHAPSGIVSANLADAAGEDDLAVANQADNNVMVFFHESGSTFSAATPVLVGHAPSSITAANLRGSAGGDLVDLIVTNQADNTISILQNNGNRSFTVLPPIPVGGEPDAIAAANLLGDALADLIIANAASNTISILENLGNNTYAPPIVLPVGVRPGQVRPADIDNDRDLDLIVSNHAGGTLSIILNQGNGSFAPAVNLPMDGQPGSLAAWDMDKDGDVDLVSVVEDQNLGEPVIRLLRNDSQANSGGVAFTVFDPIGQGENPRLVNGTDVSGDSLDDLVAVNVTTLPLHGPSQGSKAAGSSGSSSLSIRRTLLGTPSTCTGDIAPASPNFDHVVNVSDLLAVINQWGTCAGICPPYCSADINHDCTVNVTDLLSVINHWGPCP